MILKQGSTYEETEVEEREEKKPGLPLKGKVIIGVCVVAVIIIGVCILLSRGRSNVDVDDGLSGLDSMDDIYGGAEIIDKPTGDGLDSWDNIPIVTFTYTADEVAELRAWGYTGDEIEAQQLLETPAETLIAASRAAQEARTNPASPEYEALLNSTFLGQEKLNLPAEIPAGSVYYDTITLNADYEKVEAHGHNLYLKIYLKDGSYAFMECPFHRYVELEDSGNIVVTYRTSTYNGITIVSDMSEVSVG